MKYIKKTFALTVLSSILSAAILPSVSCSAVSNSTNIDNTSQEFPDKNEEVSTPEEITPPEETNPSLEPEQPEVPPSVEEPSVPDVEETPEEVETIVEGKIDEKISSALSSIDISFSEINSNPYNYNMNKSEFLNDFDPFYFSRKYPKFNASNFKLDIYAYLQTIYESSNKMLDLMIIKDQIITDTNDHTTTFTIEFSMSNPNQLVQAFQFQGKEYFVEKNSPKIVRMTADSKKIKFDIVYDPASKKNYIHWVVESVNIQVGNSQMFTVNNFSFNYVMSYAVPYYVKNIFVENKDYINEDKFNLDKLTGTQIWNDIHNYFVDSRETIMTYLVCLNSVFETIMSNVTIDRAIIKLAPTVADVLIIAKFLPKNLRSFITELLWGQKGILSLFQTYKDPLIDFIASFIGGDNIANDVLIPIFEGFNPSYMTQEKKDFILNLIKNSEIAAGPQKELVLGLVELLLNNSNIHDFIDVIFGSLSETVKLMLPQTEFVKTMFDFLQFLFSKNDGIYTIKVLDLIINNRWVIGAVLKSVFAFLGVQGIDDIIVQLYVNNRNFNKVTLTYLINETILPITRYLYSKSNYEFTTITNYGPMAAFNYNPSTKKLSFMYEMRFVFKRSLKINLLPIYTILPNNLIINKQNIPIGFIRGLNLLPHSFTIGPSDSIDMEFTCADNYIYLTPIKENNYYLFNYTIPYELDFKLNFRKGFDDLFRKAPQKAIFGLDTLHWGILKSLAETFLLPTFTITGQLGITHNNWINFNYNPQAPNSIYYFKWKNNSIGNLDSYFEVHSSNYYTVHSREGFRSEVNGKKAFIKWKMQKELESKLFDLGPGFGNAPQEMQPVVYIKPIVYGGINVAGTLNIKINVRLVEVSVYFPNPNVIDYNLSDFSKNEFVYGNVYKKTIPV